MTTSSHSPLHNLTSHIERQTDSLGCFPKPSAWNIILCVHTYKTLIKDSVKLKLIKLRRSNSRVCGINGAMSRSVSTFGCYSRIWQKQNSPLWRERPRRNIHPATLRRNPNSVRYAMHGYIQSLTKSPSRLKPSACSCNLSLNICEAERFAAANQWRILNTLRISKAMLTEKIRKQLTTLLKRPHSDWPLSDCFPLGVHKTMARTPNSSSVEISRSIRFHGFDLKPSVSLCQ